MKVISIHQPSFMPWIPFFEKIYHSDIFVLLTHCQYQKNGVQNRFMCDGRWQTMSVKSGNVPIADKEYVDPYNDWHRICERLKKHRSILHPYRYFMSKSLLNTNAAIIHDIAYNHLRIKTKIVVDYPTCLTKTDRLVDICRRHEATTYLSGPSGRQYLDLSKFEEYGIEVKFFESNNKIDIVSFLSTEG